MDGTERTALVVCRTSLRIHGADVAGAADDECRVFVGLAEGRVSEEELAAWIRARLVVVASKERAGRLTKP